MKLRPIRLLLGLCLLTPLGLLAQPAPTPTPPPARDALSAQLDRIYNQTAYKEKKFGPFQWLEGGKAYTTVEPSDATASGKDTPKGKDIVRYDAATGNRRVLVAAATLVPAAGQPPLDPQEYSWSSDGKKLLIFTNTRKVWRQNTRGDYWVLDVASGNLRKLGADKPESTPHVREVLPRRIARRVRPGQRSLGRGPRERKDHAPDLGRRPDDRQRHRGLGLRRGVRGPRRLPLEPQRPGHRVLALRRERHRRILPDQRHGHALSRRSRATRTRRSARRTRRSKSALCRRPAAPRRAGSRCREIRARCTCPGWSTSTSPARSSSSR